MIKKRLMEEVPNSKRFVMIQVFFQWLMLLCNIIMVFAWSIGLSKMYERTIGKEQLLLIVGTTIICVSIRFILSKKVMRMSFLAGKEVKQILRDKIYRKLLKLGMSYQEKRATSEIVQITVEGVEQLEIYFGSYLPQFFYSMLAPITLFIIVAFIHIKVAVILLICVPLIPASIVAVQKFAKRLLAKYWGQYTSLGDSFLENLQGMTTLKIYQADERKQKEMKQEAEHFRKVTMRVLTMQLNSITIMDLVAFGGEALGILVAVLEFQKGNISIMGMIAIILLSAEFFIPMRTLGSFFHIAMNGMAASDKIFDFLDIPEDKDAVESIERAESIRLENVKFGYDKERTILKEVNQTFEEGKFYALVGTSGSGKSTIASLLCGKHRQYEGNIWIGDKELRTVAQQEIHRHITFVGHNSYLFRGTVRYNLLLGNKNATDERLWEVLEQVKLADFLREENGLDTELKERGSNFSGGQRQRLAIARAILRDTPIYIFDEAASNIDVESENDIMELIIKMAKEKTVILISHRLANVVKTDEIVVVQKGQLVERGTHEMLLEKHGVYEKMWTQQQELEQYGKEEK